jgi:pyrimidine-nucleoside phosphorylase
MSKKLASGADAIVLDVKVGHGAFMKTEEEAVKLAKLMVQIGLLSGKKMTAILTGMDEPLGHKIGNGLEVYESIQTLQGNGPKDLVEVTVEIGAHLLLDAEIETDFFQAKKRLHEALRNGTAYHKFVQLVEAQGGDLNAIKYPETLLAKKTVSINAKKTGYIVDINALDIGKAAMRLGAGRETKEDLIYLDVGLDLHCKIGDHVEKGAALATLYVRDKGIDEASLLILNSIKIGNEKREVKLIKQTIK